MSFAQLTPHSLCFRHTEKQKLGFVPPRDLGKYSPLIKSQSMTSIQKNRGKEEALSPLHQTKTRSKVQRTQSVPTQTKASRRFHKQSSIERVVDSQDSNPQHYDSSLCNGGSHKASQVSRVLERFAQLLY